MPLILYVLGGTALVFVLMFRGVAWLFRARALTWQRTLAAMILLVLLAMSHIFTPLIYLYPKTVWPPMAPESTPAEIWDYLGKKQGGQYNACIIRDRLWSERGRDWMLTQIPLAILGTPLLVWGLLRGWPFGSRSGEPRAAKVATHGSARWRKAWELKDSLRQVSANKPQAAGIVVGSEAGGAWITKPDVGNPHALVIGATRAGKSRRVIMPTIWTLGHRGESMIITDPKGEIHSHTASWLRAKGYDVIQLDLLHPARGNRWNPLAAVSAAHAAGDTEEASRLAWEAGHILAWGQGTGSDPIWPQAEESLIAAMALATVIEAPPGTKHMSTAYRMLIELGHRGGESLDNWILSLPHDHPARLAYGTAALSESRTRSSIYTGTAAHLRLWGDPGVAWMCSESDHNPADAGVKPTAIFLLMPDEAGARRPIASLYVSQAYGALAGVARKNGGRLPVPVWFLLDEFGNIGKLPGMAEKLTVAAGRGIRFVLAVQSVAQISHVYSDRAAEILLGNCDTWVFLRAADLATAKAISAKAGSYTVKTQTLQKRYGTGLGWGSQGTEAATSRDLLTPDEVLRWEIGQSLLLQAGQYPARLPIADLSRWEAANRAFEPKPAGEPKKAGNVLSWIPPVPDPPPTEAKGAGAKQQQQPQQQGGDATKPVPAMNRVK
ncbi:MAG: type IV secretory system conjugative DNA transfer family protein [Syntrophomonadaceae bacterium]|nr:type IV secretory system conjugative DNA transfer family protein [Syntrophomonadaceae bacterium]